MKLNTGTGVAIAVGAGAVAGLHLELAKSIVRPSSARRRAGLQAALRQLQLLQARRQRLRRRIAGAAAGVVLEPDMDPAVEEGARGQHHASRREADADLRDGAGDAVAFDDQVVAPPAGTATGSAGSPAGAGSAAL